MANEEGIETTTANIITTRSPKAVTAGHKPEGWEISLEHGFADNLQDLCGQFGEQAVFDAAFSQFVVGFQGAVRRMAEAGKSDDEIKETMANWKPGMRLGLGGDPIARTIANFGNLSPEKQAEVYAALTKQYEEAMKG